jgi:asparagine synthase (glutamine-hydrolysing)
MCGICGIINFDGRSPDELHLRSMMSAMKHRGPDDEGIFLDKNVGFGFVRLSIIDLSFAGHQPFFSQDGHYMLIYNGEIFNYIELREELVTLGNKFYTGTDTEVLLAAYLHWGEDCLHKLNGMWAFVIYNLQSGEIFGARDRFGIKPFYYQNTENRFVFASEIPPILKISDKKAEAEMQSVFDYMVFNRTDQTEATFFRDIKKLQHGHWFTISASGLQIHQWYNIRDNLKDPFVNSDEFREFFNSALKLRLRSDVPVGVCLSGGLDSSSVTSTLLKEFNKKDLHTFSAVYETGQPCDESHYIHLYNDQLKNMHFITPDNNTLYNDLNDFVRIHAEPIPSTSPYAQYKVMELAAKDVVVVLDGQGADEELAGYHYFFGFFFKDLLKRAKYWTLAKEIYYYILKHHSLFGLKTFIYFLLPARKRSELRVNNTGYIKPEFVRAWQVDNVIAENLYGSENLHDALLNHFEYKLEHLLKWEDRNSMCFSVEARMPFLDYRLVEKILTTPDILLINNGMTKHLLREAMRGILPEEIRMRRDKIGFDTPQDEWFRTGQWQELVLEILDSPTFAKRNIIDVNKAKNLFQRHLKGDINIGKEIWKWVNLELWFREFIDP